MDSVAPSIFLNKITTLSSKLKNNNIIKKSPDLRLQKIHKKSIDNLEEFKILCSNVKKEHLITPIVHKNLKNTTFKEIDFNFKNASKIDTIQSECINNISKTSSPSTALITGQSARQLLAAQKAWQFIEKAGTRPTSLTKAIHSAVKTTIEYNKDILTGTPNGLFTFGTKLSFEGKNPIGSIKEALSPLSWVKKTIELTTLPYTKAAIVQSLPEESRKFYFKREVIFTELDAFLREEFPFKLRDAVQKLGVHVSDEAYQEIIVDIIVNRLKTYGLDPLSETITGYYPQKIVNKVANKIFIALLLSSLILIKKASKRKSDKKIPKKIKTKEKTKTKELNNIDLQKNKSKQIEKQKTKIAGIERKNQEKLGKAKKTLKKILKKNEVQLIKDLEWNNPQIVEENNIRVRNTEKKIATISEKNELRLMDAHGKLAELKWEMKEIQDKKTYKPFNLEDTASSKAKGKVFDVHMDEIISIGKEEKKNKQVKKDKKPEKYESLMEKEFNWNDLSAKAITEIENYLDLLDETNKMQSPLNIENTRENLTNKSKPLQLQENLEGSTDIPKAEQRREAFSKAQIRNTRALYQKSNLLTQNHHFTIIAKQSPNENSSEITRLFDSYHFRRLIEEEESVTLKKISTSTQKIWE